MPLLTASANEWLWYFSPPFISICPLGHNPGSRPYCCQSRGPHRISPGHHGWLARRPCVDVHPPDTDCSSEGEVGG